MDMENLNFETLKSSLLFNFRTGNVALDTLITGLIICMSTYIINLGTKLQNVDYRVLFEKLFGKKSDPKPTKNIINISGKEKDGYRSDTFLALIYRIKKLNCATSDISQLSEIHIYSDSHSYDYDSSDDEEAQVVLENKKKQEANLIVSQPSPFIIAENVEAEVNHVSKKEDEEDQGKSKKDVTSHEEYHTITISSATHSMDELRLLLNQWIKEYRESTKPDDFLRYFLYSESYRSSRSYEEYRFDSGKTFDNVFFPQKEAILKRLDFFTKNRDWYRKRGIPHTIGFMFYGEPGCGKTSTIKAIANYTKRHIVSIPLSKITSCKELLGIFYNSRVNDKHIPLHKRLYVLEDIDCDDLKHIVAERRNKNLESQDVGSCSEDEKDTRDQIAAQLLLAKHLMKNKNEDGNKKGGTFDLMMTNKLTLAGILEVLDGVMEMDGRMLVMTTNYPERLDEALIRPGRIDMKINFAKCTKECLIQMYEHFYEDTHTSGLWPHEFSKDRLPGDRWTPAEAAQILLGQSDNPHQALDSFVNEYPKPTISRDGRETISEGSVPNASTHIIHSNFVDKDNINESNLTDLSCDESCDSSVSVL